jgi:hypothetical protein
MRDIDKAKDLFSLKSYMEQNYGSKFKGSRIIKCPFCVHKSLHLSIIEDKLLYSFNDCIGNKAMDAIKLFQYEGLTEDEAIQKLLSITGIDKDAVIKQVEAKKKYDFNKFYHYLTNEYKKRVKIKELYKNLSMSDYEMLKIDLELEFFDELTDKIIYEDNEKQLEEIEYIKNNFITYFNLRMKNKYDKLKKTN